MFGGSGNLYQYLYGADTLTYPGITISSLSFGLNTLGFGDQFVGKKEGKQQIRLGKGKGGMDEPSLEDVL